MNNNISLEDLIGNKDIKTQISIAQGAARLNNRALPHMLLAGAPGCGKTTIAKAIASLSNSIFIEATPETLKTPESAARIFEKLPLNGYNAEGAVIGTIAPAVIFIDEAHNLPIKAQEILGIAMENFTHAYTIGKGKNKELINIWLPQFTVICATTNSGKLSKPLRDRFKLTYIFSKYSLEEAKQIILLHASRIGLSIEEDAVADIARRSRGTPRIMVRYLERAYDSMVFLNRKKVTIDLTEAMFKLMKIDKCGLNETDINVLCCLYANKDIPIGLDNIALALSESPKTISDVNEPFLILNGFMVRSSRGRIITDKGIEYLQDTGVVAPPENNKTNSRIISRKKVT